jgi:hypothetical protein
LTHPLRFLAKGGFFLFPGLSSPLANLTRVSLSQAPPKWVFR